MKIPSDITHPLHYNSSGILCEICEHQLESIDVTECFSGNISNAIKYIWRCNHKGEDVRDLQKAYTYLQRETKFFKNPYKPKIIFFGPKVTIRCDHCSQQFSYEKICKGFSENLSIALTSIFNYAVFENTIDCLHKASMYIEQEINLRTQIKLEEK